MTSTLASGAVRLLAVAALAAALLAAACGSPSPDLFAVDRSGTIPGARLHTLAGAGHAFPLEREEETVRALTDHFLSCDARAA